MLNASSEYKEHMKRKIRNRAYISVSLGIVNQKAQASAYTSDVYAPWSDTLYPFNNSKVAERYATMEQNYFSVDGNMCFVPETDTGVYLYRKGLTTNDLADEIIIRFNNKYDIKGLMLEFEYNCYPKSFEVETEEKLLNFTNDSKDFTTTEVIGYTSYIIIRPIEMVGGQQRFRLNKATMGVGLVFGNSEISNFSIDEFVHSISEELPSIVSTITILDKDSQFNVDDKSSFINFLELEQKTEISIGLELDNGDVEWIDIGSLLLSEWKSSKRTMQFTVKDRLSFYDAIYERDFVLRTRSLYDDAIDVLTDLGLQVDEYEVDECLKDVIIENPLPEATHAECLQLIANAGRCILYQKADGKICITANFATILDPMDLTVSANEQAEWSNVDNIRVGSEYVYADMTNNFFSADGSMYFMPQDENYLETSFVSADICNANGEFNTIPSVTISMPASYTYYGVNIKFDGNPPERIKIKTFRNDVLVDENTFTDLTKDTYISYEFNRFDKMVFDFEKGYPNSRILVNKISFGDLNDYVLSKDDMLEEPVAYKEELKKEVKVKLFNYITNEEGDLVEVETKNYYTQPLNNHGKTVTFENLLISTEEHARLVAEWIGNYYKNNVYYTVGSYRGEPRLQGADIIHMENDYISNLQVEITNKKLTFNGAFGGSLELRRALKMMEG
jgi:hypothetical protein